jgi:hypothetical protein
VNSWCANSMWLGSMCRLYRGLLVTTEFRRALRPGLAGAFSVKIEPAPAGTLSNKELA